MRFNGARPRNVPSSCCGLRVRRPQHENRWASGQKRSVPNLSRARMPDAVIAKIGSAARIVALEPLHAVLLGAVDRVVRLIGVIRLATIIRPSQRAADQSACG